MACSKESKYRFKEGQKIPEQNRFEEGQKIADKNRFEEGQNITEELVRLLEECIYVRQQRISDLRSIANEIDKTNISETTGKVVDVGGGLLVVTGTGLTFFTFSAAGPKVAEGYDVSGGITARGAEVVGSFISDIKIRQAEHDLQMANMMVEQITRKHEQLKQISVEIHKMDINAAYSCLFMGGRLKNAGISSKEHVLKVLSKVSSLTTLKAQLQSSEPIAEGLAKAISEATLNSTRNYIAKTVFTIPLPALDIVSILQTSIDIHQRSKSNTARTLRELADKIKEQLQAVELFIDGIRNLQKTFTEKILEEFKKQIQCISPRGHATEEETEFVMNSLRMFSSPEFEIAFVRSGLDVSQFVFYISRLTQIIWAEFQDEVARRRNEQFLNVTIIGHGNIQAPLIFSQLHYLSPSVNAVTLYSPWGCAIDSSVAYGIATGNINIGTVQYSQPVYPHTPNNWNTLPASANYSIPLIVLNPLTITDRAHIELQHMHTALSMNTTGLVITYVNYNGIGLEFPQMPFWVICSAIGLLASFAQKQCHIHNATCLAVDQNLDYGQLVDPHTVSFIDSFGYCSVAVTQPPAMMTNTIVVPVQMNMIIGQII